MPLPMILARYRQAVDAELHSVLDGRLHGLFAMVHYHLGWLDERGEPGAGPAGKALRPALCLLACEALAGTTRPALPAAAALELLHNASLIHDDIQDEDRERRHRPTVWAIWGQAQALNAGNALASISTLSLQRLADVGVAAERRLRAHQLFYETCLRLVEGQCLDIGFEHRLDVTTPEYLAMAERKTAASLACALAMGALLAGGDERTIAALRDCGRSLGLAFQISDDLLGIYGDGAKMGKPVGSDIRRHKRSFPIVYALGHAQGAARRRLAQALAAPPGGDDGLADIADILACVGAHAHALRQVQAYCDRATSVTASAALPAWARSSLQEVACYLAEREA